MKERPVLFSGLRVRQILADQKVQTRRVINPQPTWVTNGGGVMYWKTKVGMISEHACPYGKPGDRLWVRETFRLFDSLAECACDDDCVCSRYHGKPIYRASAADDEGPWKPSIFMPRWACRLVLEVTEVGVERLHDLTEEDARAEGVETKASFSTLWESIHGRGAWDENPWVWVVKFKRLNGEPRA